MQPMLEGGGVRSPSLWRDWIRLLGEGRVGERERTQSLLVLRFTLMNMVGIALVGAVWMQGWLEPLVAGASRWMVPVIVAVFAVGLAWCGRLVMDTGVELDQLKSGRLRPGSRVSRYLTAASGACRNRRRALEEALKIKLHARMAGVRHIAGSLVFLGLIGTVIGFMIALDGVDAANAADPASVAPMVATLIDGMGLALSTTLVGAVLNLWLMSAYRVLENGTAKLYAELIERGGADDADG